jgi:hypothetical protein
MIIAINSKDQRIIADDANKLEKYRCPFCKTPVVLKSGSIKIHHFAHQTVLDCKNNDREMTEWHIDWQKSFGLENSEVIMSLGNHTRISDINIKNIVVEFQHSPITYKEAKKRTVFYTQDGKKCFWIFDFRENYQSRQITIKRAMGYNDLVYEWKNANKAVLAGVDSRGDGAVTLFIQIQDDKLVEVFWNLKDEQKEINSFKYFRGYLRSRQEVIRIIKAEIVTKWTPTQDYEKTEDYWQFLHLLEMIDAGVH